jgi:uncharacterized membrane protein YbhN (UPF0104 family)/tRNA A-37 threonylcarbamoyl transferase component Bud32
VVPVKLQPSDLSPLRIFRMFSSSTRAPRQRRPTDIVLLVLALLVMALTVVNAPGPTALDEAIVGVLDELPDALGPLWGYGYTLLAVWVLVLLLAPIVRHGHGRLRLLWDYALALVIATVLVAGISAMSGTSLSDLVRALVAAEPPPVYAAARLALATAVIVTASPHVTRPFSVIGRTILAVGAVAAVALEIAHPSGVVAGWAVGLAAASAVHLLLGSPGGQLTAEQVAEALLDLGVGTESVRIAQPRSPGEQLLLARAADGEDLEVKVFGRDAWDAQYVGSLWAALTRRGEAPRLSMSRRERVEHEAMISLLAQRAGVPVLPVVTSGLGVQGEAILVTSAPGRALDELPAASVDDAWLHAVWSALDGLHEAGIVHRSITSRHLVEGEDGMPALADFAHARLAPSRHELMIDRVHLLVTLSLAVGHERAVASAAEALGDDGLAAALPYLQDPVLSAPLRRAMDPQWDLEELRALAIERSGAEAAPLVELRRVTVASFLKLFLGVFIAASLVGLLAGVDFAAVVDELSTADYRLLLLALLVAPLAQVLFSFSTLGASLRRLPFLPVLMLQYAIQFIALVLPATAARIALQIRFFERLGVSYGAATSMGAIDGFGGFVVQVLLLLVIGLSSLPGFTTGVSTGSDTGGEESGDPSLVAMAVAIGLIWTVVTLAVPRRRARIRREIPRFIAQMRDQASQARSSLAVLRHPRKVAAILGGNLGGQVVQAVVLGICLSAFGESASLSQLILVNTFVSLFAGLLPVPGGVGVAEAGYTYGLQAIGVPSAVAVSTAIAFRLVTFYLPPLWCSQAMRWLRRNAYV